MICKELFIFVIIIIKNTIITVIIIMAIIIIIGIFSVIRVFELRKKSTKLGGVRFHVYI